MATSKKTKVLFQRSPTGDPFLLAYNEGEVAEIEDAVAVELIELGIATELSKPVEKATEKATVEKAVVKKTKKATK